MSNKTEIRDLVTHSMEIREDEEGTKTITGYAVKWEMKSEVMGLFRNFKEQFQKGAFADSLIQDDQRFLWSHDVSQVLGRTKNSTLRLFEDNIGLRFELDLPATTLGNDTYESVKRGDVDGMSFGFQMLGQEWDTEDENNRIRTITKAKLIEVSCVAFPAYPDSEVSARGYDPTQTIVNEEQRKAQILKLKTYI